MTVFAQLMQGDIGVEEFSARIKKISKLAEISPEQQREQFIRGLNPMNQYNIRMMAKFHGTQDNIAEALAEGEKIKLFQGQKGVGNPFDSSALMGAPPLPAFQGTHGNLPLAPSAGANSY